MRHSSSEVKLEKDGVIDGEISAFLSIGQLLPGLINDSFWLNLLPGIGHAVKLALF